MSLRLKALEKVFEACQACDLHLERKQIVFGSGNVSRPPLMFVGEGPGQEEDLQGKPFIGRAGSKLDQILAYIGVKREDVYITNAVLCRPPGNRNPELEELAACSLRLQMQIDLIQPRRIVALGRFALQALLGEEIEGPLKEWLGEMEYEIGPRTYSGWFSYHPSFHLRSPDLARKLTMPIWTEIRNYISRTQS